MEDDCLRASFTVNVSQLRFAYFFVLTFDLNSFREFINLLLPVYNFFLFFFFFTRFTTRSFSIETTLWR